VGPASARRSRAVSVCAPSACLLLAVVVPSSLQAQALTADLFRPVKGGFVQPKDLPTRKSAEQKARAPVDEPRLVTLDGSEPSSGPRSPNYAPAPAAEPGEFGYDPQGRRHKVAKLYPGQPKPKKLPPGAALRGSQAAPEPPVIVRGNRTPVAPGLAGTVPGQPPRKRLKPDDNPFDPIGSRVGGFLVKSAVELRGGYDSNPARINIPKGAAFYVMAPELMVTSNWSRHALVADLRGSYTGYGTTLGTDGNAIPLPAPVNLDRPSFDGHIDGRLDATRDTKLLGQLRMRVFTDNPGSPNIQTGLTKYPLGFSAGSSLGIDQSFNRLQIAAVGSFDRTTYQPSQLTDGTTDSNSDRNYNQYGGVVRVSYELMPGVKPFGEAQLDRRVRDFEPDRSLYFRNSNGTALKGGTSFEFSRLLTGEIALGYGMRSYADPRLSDLAGLLTSGSLIWTATPLTTARFSSTTSLDETTLAGVSGVLTRSYSFQVDHDFRRWLTAIGRFSWGTSDYQGSDRFDTFGSVGGDLVYKMNRNLQVKAQLRRDWLDSNVPGSSTAATVVTVGVRLQH
jgi:hypothetical protein